MMPVPSPSCSSSAAWAGVYREQPCRDALQGWECTFLQLLLPVAHVEWALWGHVSAQSCGLEAVVVVENEFVH